MKPQRINMRAGNTTQQRAAKELSSTLFFSLFLPPPSLERANIHTPWRPQVSSALPAKKLNNFPGYLSWLNSVALARKGNAWIAMSDQLTS